MNKLKATAISLGLTIFLVLAGLFIADEITPVEPMEEPIIQNEVIDEPVGAINVYKKLDLNEKLLKIEQINSNLEKNHTIKDVDGDLFGKLINKL